MLTRDMQRANTTRAKCATWVAPYPNNDTSLGVVYKTSLLFSTGIVSSAVAYLTCINIALDNGAQALERWCDKWL